MKKAPFDRRLDVILNGFECLTKQGKSQGVGAGILHLSWGGGGRRCGMGGVEYKPRDLRSDRGYRAAIENMEDVVVVWAMFNLNPHPFKTKKGAAPKCRRGGYRVRCFSRTMKTRSGWVGVP